MQLQDIGCAGTRRSGATSHSRPIGIALALAILFAVLIARPIRQLDQAIRQMGTADFTHANRGQRAAGPALPRPAARMAAFAAVRSRGAADDRFLRHVSHELKTPLTAVREGAPSCLRDNVGGKLSPEQREIVRIVRENYAVAAETDRRLAHLSPDARDGAGRRWGRCCWPTCCAAWCKRAQARGARPDDRVRGPKLLAATLVVGDAEKLRTIIDNLVVQCNQVFAAVGNDRTHISPNGRRIRRARRHPTRATVHRSAVERQRDLRLVLLRDVRPPKAG